VRSVGESMACLFVESLRDMGLSESEWS